MDTYTFDLGRILIGDTSPLLLLEIILRTILMYCFTLALLRLVGNRGVGQLSLVEFTLIIGLGSAVGDPMFQIDIPVLHGCVVVTMVVLLQRFITRLTITSPYWSRVIDGQAVRLVVDGQIDRHGLRRAHLSEPELYAELRQAGIDNVRHVRRAYLEPDGEFSVFRISNGSPTPMIDLDLVNEADKMQPDTASSHSA